MTQEENKEWEEKIQKLCADPKYNRENANDPMNVFTREDLEYALGILQKTTMTSEEIYEDLLHAVACLPVINRDDPKGLEVPGDPRASLKRHVERLAQNYSPEAEQKRMQEVEREMAEWTAKIQRDVPRKIRE